MRRRESLWVLSGGLSAWALTSACLPREPGVSGARSGHPLAGKKAPSLASLSYSASAKVTLVDFWASWCGPCVDAFAAYERLLLRHPRDVHVIGVSLDESKSVMDDFRASARVTFPLVWDDAQEIARAFRVPSLPTCFAIDRAKIVRHVFVGFLPEDEARLEGAVAELLS